MEKLFVVVFYLLVSITPNEARAYSRSLRFQVYRSSEKKLTHIAINPPLMSAIEGPNSLSSPFSLPPSGSPSPLSPPSNTPRFCVNEPPPLHPPPLVRPTPTNPPPPTHTFSSPPKQVPRSPQIYTPPSSYYPPPETARRKGVWCVAKPTVPGGIIQAAMDYACGSGADCKAIELNGTCFQPDTVLAHASFAFNSYWQKAKLSGGTCDFGGTAMLVAVDPSFDGCIFIINS